MLNLVQPSSTFDPSSHVTNPHLPPSPTTSYQPQTPIKPNDERQGPIPTVAYKFPPSELPIPLSLSFSPKMGVCGRVKGLDDLGVSHPAGPTDPSSLRG